jgi:diguanylate cyclase (GGDEF)-like protein/PAS domain S-box-containing protein
MDHVAGMMMRNDNCDLLRHLAAGSETITARRLYDLIIFGAGLTVVGLTLFLFPPPGPLNYGLVGAIVALIVLGRRSSFRVGYSAKSHMGTPAAMIGLLLLDPSLAILVAFLGVLVDEFVPGGWSRSRPFNLGQVPIQMLVAVGVLSLMGWNPADPHFSDPLMLTSAFVAGALAIATSAMLVGTSEWFETGGQLQNTLWRVLYGGGPEILLSDVSKICFGVVAALLVNISLWFIVLLIVPIATMSQAISRAVRLRGQLETALYDTEHSLGDAQRLANLGSWTWNLADGSVNWSQHVFDIFGISAGDGPRSLDHLRQILAPEDRHTLNQAIDDAIRDGTAVEFDHDIRRPDGEVRHVHHRIKVIPGDDPSNRRLLGTVHDITDRKQLERQLRFLAYHDGLTGLPNRDLFIDRLAAALKTECSRSRAEAVLFVDLDHFKSINDRYGHEAGDAVLVEVARRLRTCIGPSDLAARLSGDEFTVLVTADGRERRVERLVKHILEALREPVLACGTPVHLSASAGLVYVEARHQSPSDLLRESDRALYQAKREGRGRFAIFPVDLPDAAPGFARQIA